MLSDATAPRCFEAFLFGSGEKAERRPACLQGRKQQVRPLAQAISSDIARVQAVQPSRMMRVRRPYGPAARLRQDNSVEAGGKKGQKLA